MRRRRAGGRCKLCALRPVAHKKRFLCPKENKMKFLPFYKLSSKNKREKRTRKASKLWNMFMVRSKDYILTLLLKSMSLRQWGGGERGRQIQVSARAVMFSETPNENLFFKQTHKRGDSLSLHISIHSRHRLDLASFSVKIFKAQTQSVSNIFPIKSSPPANVSFTDLSDPPPPSPP